MHLLRYCVAFAFVLQLFQYALSTSNTGSISSNDSNTTSAPFPIPSPFTTTDFYTSSIPSTSTLYPNSTIDILSNLIPSLSPWNGTSAALSEYQWMLQNGSMTIDYSFSILSFSTSNVDRISGLIISNFESTLCDFFFIGILFPGDSIDSFLIFAKRINATFDIVTAVPLHRDQSDHIFSYHYSLRVRSQNADDFSVYLNDSLKFIVTETDHQSTSLITNVSQSGFIGTLSTDSLITDSVSLFLSDTVSRSDSIGNLLNNGSIEFEFNQCPPIKIESDFIVNQSTFTPIHATNATLLFHEILDAVSTTLPSSHGVVKEEVSTTTFNDIERVDHPDNLKRSDDILSSLDSPRDIISVSAAALCLCGVGCCFAWCCAMVYIRSHRNAQRLKEENLDKNHDENDNMDSVHMVEMGMNGKPIMEAQQYSEYTNTANTVSIGYSANSGIEAPNTVDVYVEALDQDVNDNHNNNNIAIAAPAVFPKLQKSCSERLQSLNREHSNSVERHHVMSFYEGRSSMNHMDHYKQLLIGSELMMEDMLRTLGGPSNEMLMNQEEVNEDEDAKSPEVECERVTGFEHVNDVMYDGNGQNEEKEEEEEEEENNNDDDIVIITKGGDDEVSLERDEFVVEGDDEVTLKEVHLVQNEENEMDNIIDKEDGGGLNEQSMDDEVIIEDILTLETLECVVDYQTAESIDVDAIEL